MSILWSVALLSFGTLCAAPLSQREAKFLAAAEAGDSLVVAHCVSEGINLNVRRKEGGYTALMIACINGHGTVFMQLLDAGADLEAMSIDPLSHATGNTALMLASRYGYDILVKQLLSAGASCHAISSDGSTALSYAVKNGHMLVEKELLKAGTQQQLHPIR